MDMLVVSTRLGNTTFFAGEKCPTYYILYMITLSIYEHSKEYCTIVLQNNLTRKQRQACTQIIQVGIHILTIIVRYQSAQDFYNMNIIVVKFTETFLTR